MKLTLEIVSDERITQHALERAISGTLDTITCESLRSSGAVVSAIGFYDRHGTESRSTVFEIRARVDRNVGRAS